MRLTCRLLRKKSASSARWLERQQNDPYVRSRFSPSLLYSSGTAPEQITFRSRSAFKLVSLARSYPLLGPGQTVVDLGAAPGGWSQVAATAGRGRSKVIAIDINHMEPITGVDFIQGDFLDPIVQERVRELVGGGNGTGKVETVLSDMMAPMTGVRIKDVAASLDLVMAATSFALSTLRVGSGKAMESGKAMKAYDGGKMVLKFFMHPDLDDFKRNELVPRFGKVVVDKPRESRKESSEAYFVCLGFKG